MSAPSFQAGFVALLGLPNVGKSTLMNRLVGAHLSIATPKAQTTRRRVAGIYTDDRGQAIFLDTPGRLEPRYLLQEAMQGEVRAAQTDADVLVYVADAGWAPSLEDARTFGDDGRPRLLCLNKVDRVEGERRDSLVRSFRETGWEEVHPTVATTGEGVDALRTAILGHLPESPAPLYPEDELATEPVRWFVGELVREACFEQLGQEVPYSTAVRVDAFEEREGGRPLYIGATVFVERPSQKGIVIGSGGRRIREIGTEARKKIEAFLERSIYLDLRVKVLRKWRKRRDHLRRLGFRPPPEG